MLPCTADDEQAIVATHDFFTPIVDDPYDFGLHLRDQRALRVDLRFASNPIFALAIVGPPPPHAAGKMSVAVIQKILRGRRVGGARMRASDRGLGIP